MTRRQIDLDQLFVAVLDGEPWLPDVAGTAIRAGRRRQRRARAAVVALTAAAVAAVMFALPTLGIMPKRGGDPVLVAGAPTPSLTPGAPLSEYRPPLEYASTSRSVTRDGQDWSMTAATVFNGGELASAAPVMLRAAVISALRDRHDAAAVGRFDASGRDYSTSLLEGQALAWADGTLTWPGAGPLPVRVGLWLSHPSSWEGCGVGESECQTEVFQDDGVSTVSYRVVTRDPDTGEPVTSWWARARKYSGLLTTVEVRAPLDREEAVELARQALLMAY